MTAAVNAGIVRFLNDKNSLDDWKRDVERAFPVCFSSDAQNISVTGKLEDILNFENYLENYFPKNAESALEDMNIKSPLQTVSSSYQNEFDNSFEDIGTTCYNEKSVKGLYTFGQLEVALYHGDITGVVVDCIVSSAIATLYSSGMVASAIEKAGGEDYRNSCRQEIAMHGDLKEGECRVTKSGKLGCKNVIHANVPSLSKQDPEDLMLLRTVIISCFETADAYGHQSIAVPGLGTGNCLLDKFPKTKRISKYF